VLDFPFHVPDGSISPPPTERDRARRPYSYHIPRHLLLDMLVREVVENHQQLSMLYPREDALRDIAISRLPKPYR
jgi:hypothetical protein